MMFIDRGLNWVLFGLGLRNRAFIGNLGISRRNSSVEKVFHYFVLYFLSLSGRIIERNRK
jgi:hypothetical protein